jgi:predicted TIM-barrel fold metal-dependent hydrolase
MDKIMLGTDYPYEEMDECMSFLEGLQMSTDERALLYHENAAGLGLG